MGSDHAGFPLKERLIQKLHNEGHEVIDFGTSSETSTDYPDYAHPVADCIEKGEAALGILMCGSGNGINMAANKHQGIRSALCWLPEIAEMARLHNNSNILALPARYIAPELAEEIVDTFLSNEFEGGRHQRRVEKIAAGVENC